MFVIVFLTENIKDILNILPRSNGKIYKISGRIFDSIPLMGTEGLRDA
jgi:hypothetical protein